MTALLLESTIQVSLILAAGLIASRLYRHRSAGFRHWLLATAIACAAVAPVTAHWLPSWTLDLPAWTLKHAPASGGELGALAAVEGPSAPTTPR